MKTYKYVFYFIYYLLAIFLLASFSYVEVNSHFGNLNYAIFSKPYF